MTEDPSTDGYLAGQLLVAMPQMLDERFVKTVIYMPIPRTAPWDWS